MTNQKTCGFIEIDNLKDRLDTTRWGSFVDFDADEAGIASLLHAQDVGLKYKLKGLLSRIARHIKANAPQQLSPKRGVKRKREPVSAVSLATLSSDGESSAEPSELSELSTSGDDSEPEIDAARLKSTRKVCSVCCVLHLFYEIE